MKWTEERVAFAVATKLFDWKRHIVVPNLSWGMGLGFEIDLGILSSANWLTEVEIKVSLSDLRREGEKWRHKIAPQLANVYQSKIRKRFIAMPLELWNKRYNPSLRTEFPTIPEGVGVITVYGDMYGDTAKIEKPALPDKAARKLTPDEREQMIRLGYLRFWAQRQANDILQAGIARTIEEHITKAAVSEPQAVDADA